ncbi:MAG: dTDP-4-dehydrorhamnose reductase [Planctomycetaceae bacterium]|nr:dTDP-4-dehydrorhamnose reductase [Planctomycetaceae bacterium]
MRIALIGAAGQLGTDMLPVLGEDVVPLGHDAIEVTSIESVHAALSAAEPEIVINLAAYNLVDRAEQEPEQAFAVNADGPRNLARWCESRGIALLHVSTDYVFGQDRARSEPYRESDATGALSVYGQSKLTGEEAVAENCRRHLIVRTCGLYGHAALKGAGKGNFVETMLRLGGERDSLGVVDDQRCTPTSTEDLARGIAALVETQEWGTYHVTNSGSMTWCEFATEILGQSGMSTIVRPVSSAEFGAAAERPAYSVLCNTRFEDVTGFELPHWKDALARYLGGR